MRRIVMVSAGLSAGVLAASLIAAPASANSRAKLVLTVIDSSSATTQIARMTASGKAPSIIGDVEPGVWAQCASWWQGRNRILFTQQQRNTGGQYSALSMTRKGGDITPVPNSKGISCLSADADGKRFAYIRYGNVGGGGVGTMRANGKGAKELAGPFDGMYFSPAMSPDGTRVAYQRVTYKGDSIKRSDIVIADVATGAKTRITKSRNAQFGSPSWVDNSTLLAVRGNAGIVTLRSDGSQVRRITYAGKGGAFASSPSISPNGRRVAYLTCIGDCGDPDLKGTGAVWTVKRDGSDRQRLLNSDGDLQPNTSIDWFRPTSNGRG